MSWQSVAEGAAAGWERDGSDVSGAQVELRLRGELGGRQGRREAGDGRSGGWKSRGGQEQRGMQLNAWHPPGHLNRPCSP